MLRSKFHKQISDILGSLPDHYSHFAQHNIDSFRLCRILHSWVLVIWLYTAILCRFCDWYSSRFVFAKTVLLSRNQAQERERRETLFKVNWFECSFVKRGWCGCPIGKSPSKSGYYSRGQQLANVNWRHSLPLKSSFIWTRNSCFIIKIKDQVKEAYGSDIK